MGSLLLNVGSALRSLREQWQRATLSALGIMVGSVAIVLLVSIARGVQADLSKQVSDLGVNLLVVLPGRLSETSMMSASMIGISYLSEDDVARVKTVPGVKNAVPLSFIGGGIRFADKTSPSTLVIATEPGWFSMRNLKMHSGRLFGPQDADQAVCILGGVANKNLFPGRDAVGSAIRYNGREYRVLGVTEDQASENSLFSQGSLENVVYVPFRFMKRQQGQLQLNRIMIQTEPDREPKSLVRAVEGVLAQHLDRENYSVLTQEDLLRLVFKLMGILTWLLTGLTSIALFVGGVGIMTVMLMSVNERAKEIGIRKTVGARRVDIFAQFLVEAVFLALLGGVVGLAISYGVCLALYYETPIKPMITPGIVGLSFAVSLGLGTVFGLIPAMKAARKDPVESLRKE